MLRQLTLVAVALMIGVAVSAQRPGQIPLPPSQNPSAIDLPISAAVWSGNTLYVSGWLDPDLKAHTDVKSQTMGIFEDIKKLLASQGLSLGDVVMIHMYLGGELGKPDVAGMTAAYVQFFGTKEQPGRPARTTTQVVLPAGARGALVEVDLIAARPN